MRRRTSVICAITAGLIASYAASLYLKSREPEYFTGSIDYVVSTNRVLTQDEMGAVTQVLTQRKWGPLIPHAWCAVVELPDDQSVTVTFTHGGSMYLQCQTIK